MWPMIRTRAARLVVGYDKDCDKVNKGGEDEVFDKTKYRRRHKQLQLHCQGSAFTNAKCEDQISNNGLAQLSLSLLWQECDFAHTRVALSQSNQLQYVSVAG